MHNSFTCSSVRNTRCRAGMHMSTAYIRDRKLACEVTNHTEKSLLVPCFKTPESFHVGLCTDTFTSHMHVITQLYFIYTCLPSKWKIRGYSSLLLSLLVLALLSKRSARLSFLVGFLTFFIASVC